VIGGSDAGVSAGLRARELDRGVEVTLLVADAYPNYSICGLPYYLSGEVADWRALAHRSIGELEAAGIQPLVNTPPTPSTRPPTGSRSPTLAAASGSWATTGWWWPPGRFRPALRSRVWTCPGCTC